MQTITGILIELGTKVQQNIMLKKSIKPIAPHKKRKENDAWIELQELSVPENLAHASAENRQIHGSSAGSTTEAIVSNITPVLSIAGATNDQLELLAAELALTGGQWSVSAPAFTLAVVTAGFSASTFISEEIATLRALRDDPSMSKQQKALTIIDGLERSTIAAANMHGSTTTALSQLLKAVKPGPLADILGVAGSGTLAGINVLSSLLELYSNIQEAVRYGGIRKTSLALLTLLSVYDEEVKKITNPFSSEASIKRSFLTDSRCSVTLAPYHWFCFKYHKTVFGHMRFGIEKIGIPLLGLATGCLSIALISTTVASGGIALVTLGGVAASAGVLFSGYKIGKYAQSVSAFQELMRPQAHSNPTEETVFSTIPTITLNEKDERQISACLGFRHRFFGIKAHKLRHPIDAYRGQLHAAGVTLGDWYRFQLAKSLLELIYQYGTESDETTGFRHDPNVFFASRQTRELRQLLSTHEYNHDNMQAIRQNFDWISSDLNMLLTRGVWEIIKADLSEHTWRAALQEIEKYLPHYCAIRDSFMVDSQSISSRRPPPSSSSSSSQPKRPSDDLMFLDDTAKTRSDQIEAVETRLLQILFGMLRVNA